MSNMDRLDTIWETAIKKSPCKCETDLHWSQSVLGDIKCDKCHKKVVKHEQVVEYGGY